MGNRAHLWVAAAAAWAYTLVATEPAWADGKCQLSGTTYLLFDGDGSRADTKNDKKLMDEIARAARNAPLCVIAHVDSTGDVNYTRRLAIRRAMYVVDELSELGLKKEQMVVELRAIDGNVRKSPDRRVEVIVGH